MAIMTDEERKFYLAKDPDKNTPNMDITLEEVESFGNTASLNKMAGKINSYRKQLKQRITFINRDLTDLIPFTRENLYLICAYTGNGKSTVAANISYPLWQEGKKVLVIANEETSEDILFRISCLHLGINYNDYKKGRMDRATTIKVMSYFPEIVKHVKIFDVNFREGLTTHVEGVKSIMTAVKDVDYSCVLIDYYQLIKFTVSDKSASTYDVLNNFRIWLGQYIKNSNVPVAIFAQLHSLGKRNNKDLDSRVKHCADILETATVAIEVIPDFASQTSNFIIHKDRFGYANAQITCGYDAGKFVSKDDPGFLVRRDKYKIDQIVGTEEEDNDDKHEEVPDLQGRPEE